MSSWLSLNADCTSRLSLTASMCLHVFPVVLALLQLPATSAASFDALPAPLSFVNDAAAESGSVSCDQASILRATIDGSTLPDDTTPWTLSLALTPTATNGYFFCFPALSIRRAAGTLVLEDSRGAELARADGVTWAQPATRVSLSQSADGSRTLCVGGTDVKVPDRVLQRVTLARGFTLGDPKSLDSLSGTYSSLYVSNTGTASCAEAAALAGARPAATSGAEISSLQASRGEQLFVGDEAVFSADAAMRGAGSGAVRLRITAYGLPVQPCVTAECGDLITVRSRLDVAACDCNKRQPCAVHACSRERVSAVVEAF